MSSVKDHVLIPAIVQDSSTRRVLMLGYMNHDALEVTQKTGYVTFFSRSRNELWTKGATSGNLLRLVSLKADCDGDAILVTAEPAGPTCHLGTNSCFEHDVSTLQFAMDKPGDCVDSDRCVLATLERIVEKRRTQLVSNPDPLTYTQQLLSGDLTRVAQKVGEEGVEVALAAVAHPENIPEEAADLLYHLIVLLVRTGHSVAAVEKVLLSRVQDQ